MIIWTLSIKFPFDKQELKENPDSLIDLVEQLWNENQDLKEKIEKLEGNLQKYTSPHIPYSIFQATLSQK